MTLTIRVTGITGEHRSGLRALLGGGLLLPADTDHPGGLLAHLHRSRQTDAIPEERHQDGTIGAQ